MRNLILLCLIIMIVLFGFYTYLEINKGQFIEIKSQQLAEEMPTIDSAPSAVKIDEDEVAQTEPGTLVDVPDFSADTEATSKSSRSTNSTNNGTQELSTTSNTVAEPVENLLSEEVVSEEVEGLFSKYHGLREKRRALAAELNPIQLEYISIISEINEIMRGERDISADETAKANARLTRGKELELNIFELQEESERLSEAFKALLGEYGFSSEEKFYQTHREAYKSWQAAR